MKYSITLASFRNLEPIEQTLSKLSSQNYDAIEMYGEPAEVDVKSLKDIFSTGRLQVCGITGMWGRASKDGGNRKLLSANQNVLAKSEKYVLECIRMCSELGAKEMNICLFADDIADLENTHGTIGKERENQLVKMSLPMLRRLCKEAINEGVLLALEPLNRYSTPYCATASDALEIAKQVDNLGILLDTFHMNIEEDSFETAISMCSKHLLHTHFADNNRKMPGFAHIDFNIIMKNLLKIGYDDYVSFEPNIYDTDYEYSTKYGLEFMKRMEAANSRQPADKFLGQ